MDRKKKIAIVALVLVVAAGAAVLGFLLLDELAAQLICILSAMILAAVVLALSIEKESLRNLVLAPAPVVSVLFLKFFDSSELAGRLGGWYNAAVAFICQRMGMEVPGVIGNQTALAITFCIIVGLIYLIVWGVRSWIKGKTAASSGEPKPDKDFPERNYQQKRKSFCKFLAKRIDAINEETNWSEETFTPIEAEVEATVKRRKKRRYEDLHKCLRRHRRKNTVFLVLGDPGAGKSVSMRKLCADMLEEADKTDLIPVYVDLKKWTEDWSLERRPTEADLVDFIENRILREGGTTYTDAFLQKYFRKMLEQGKWYFIFDSFDEMPCLMGRRSCQELIDHISSLLHTFLTRENQRGGVIASRLFRAPTDALHAAIKLNLQPFSDAKIKRMLNLYTNNSDELVRLLFSGREDLVSLCRNPFYLSLLIEYSMNHGAALPGNQMDLYEDFIQSRLSRCEGKIDEMGLKNVRQVRDAARQLALYMQESTQYGLECPASELYRRNDGYDWQKILELLRYAKLCRFGGASSTVSFVHRRFQECFYVSNIKENRIQLDPESYGSIEKNTGIRDALVLYCEIAPLEKAREIADHCWSVLQQNKAASESIRKPGCVELVNTLYFMAEAFRNRREAMAHFQTDFQKFTLEMLETQEFVVQYAAASSMVLFEQPELLKMVLEVLKKENRYLSGVVMKNCRTMTEIPWEISYGMACYIVDMDSSTFVRRFWSMDFSLSMSKQLWYVRLVHAVRYSYELLGRLIWYLGMPVIVVWMLTMRLTGQVEFLYEYDALKFMCATAIFSLGANTTCLAEKHLRVLRRAFVYISSFFVSLYLDPVILYQLCIPVLIVSVLHIIVFYGIGLGWILYKEARLFRAMLKICMAMATGILMLLVFKIICDVLPYIGVLIAILLLLGLGFLYAVIMNCRELVSSFRQRHWIRHQMPVITLDRSVLALNLKKQLETDTYRRRYLEDLVERKVTLTGEWPEGKRPEMTSDDVERLLAILDCGDLKSLRKEF